MKTFGKYVYDHQSAQSSNYSKLFSLLVGNLGFSSFVRTFTRLFMYFNVSQNSVIYISRHCPENYKWQINIKNTFLSTVKRMTVKNCDASVKLHYDFNITVQRYFGWFECILRFGSTLAACARVQFEHFHQISRNLVSNGSIRFFTCHVEE